MKVREVFISNAALYDKAACEHHGGPGGVVRAILNSIGGPDLKFYAGREPHEADSSLERSVPK